MKHVLWADRLHMDRAGTYLGNLTADLVGVNPWSRNKSTFFATRNVKGYDVTLVMTRKQVTSSCVHLAEVGEHGGQR